jgi:hypothetical protein
MFTLLAGMLRKLKALSVDVYVDLVIMLTYAVLMVLRIGGSTYSLLDKSIFIHGEGVST